MANLNDYDEELGYIYLRARYYDMDNGRFLSEDTNRGEPNNALSLNLYNYCWNNPILYTDSTGNWPETKNVTQTLARWLIANPVAVYETQNGKFKDLFYAAGFVRDSGGVYHARPDAIQQLGGYNDFYDIIFEYATSMDKEKFQFTSGGREYMFWAWKGNYLNLGAGAELGIYSNKSGILGEIDVTSPNNSHWLVDTNLAMTMKLTLNYKNGSNIISYKPSEKQWWITGFNPFKQGVRASDLTAIYTVTFNNKTMFNDFYNKFGKGDNKDSRWTFDPKKITAMFVF